MIIDMIMNLPVPGQDQWQVPPYGGQSGKHLHEERSARQERSDFSAKTAPEYGQYHPPLCRIVVGGDIGAGADLEPLIACHDFPRRGQRPESEPMVSEC